MPNASHTHTPRKAGVNWHQRYLTPSFVTCEDYQRFLEDTGAFRQLIHWVAGHAPQEGTASVLGVYPEDARAFCSWLSAATAITWRLPHPGALAGMPGV
ncbi:MAG: SUMF1/EgtB/PvdO family nonheme iron enzyme [Chloroflexi bacterium]|jgi:formylglycine-generating enzyme required for sulfatase activity|nr:SUMF1/EgtB/PvdO family nonheme iron enzyme [Chloroflexota bacterium]